MTFIPELDDIDFDRLVAEGRAVIPRYAPGWTDHNLHDPGITIIDLIAYLVDRQVYRIGFVGDSLIGAFTRLMGVTPEGPCPARVLIWPASDGPGILDLEPGTVIETPDVDGAVWTLDAHIRTVAAQIADFATVSGDGDRKLLGPGLAEGRDPLPILPFSGGGPRSLEIMLTQDIQPLENDGFISLGILMQTPAPEGANWGPCEVDQWDEAGYWRPLVTRDLTSGLARDGAVLFRTRDAGAARRFRIRLDAGFRPASATLTRVGLNVLPATEGHVLPMTVLTESTGLPDQSVTLTTDNLVEDGHLIPPLDGPTYPLTIRVTDGGAEVEWTRVSDFEASGPNDTHVRITGDKVIFGNGLNGMIPPPGAQISHDDLRRTSGAAGAVASGLDWRIAGFTYGRNFTPSTAGRDGDTLADLVARARAVAKGRDGHLRSDQLEDELKAAALGLQRVNVTPRRRPAREDAQMLGSRTILVLPTRDATLAPVPTDPALLTEINRDIAPGRLLGERLHVSPPMYRDVDIAVALVVEADADVERVEAAAKSLLRARLWDLPRTSDQPVEPWPPGRAVTVGEFETLVAKVPEVIRVTDCRIAVAGLPLTRDTIPLGDREIALGRNIDVTLHRNSEGTP